MKEREGHWKKVTSLWVNLKHRTCGTGLPKGERTESGTNSCEETIGGTYKLRDNMKLRKLQVDTKIATSRDITKKLLKSKAKEEILIAVRGKK